MTEIMDVSSEFFSYRFCETLLRLELLEYITCVKTAFIDEYVCVLYVL